MTSPLPAIRRVVTSHSSEGEARVWIDDEVKRVPVPGTSDGVTFSLAWVTDEHPAEIQTEVDGATLKIGELTNDNGSVVRYVDMPPGHTSPMHRTTSIDYGFVLFGSIELELSDGSRTHIKQGEMVVQRGTDHLWRNPSATEWARKSFPSLRSSWMVYVLLPAKPIVIDGQVLGDKSIH
ncbi:cupin domain protein [Leucosporidium creatinivorum]|uniref:Cupin domain protein n=1 Tax=Leucosporidium creatinivorum TaxID=106004 RepID=A0A1Y2G0A6_9BASI|nr:cupin domain protein [Leucosporidium creatinivorum]